MNKQHLAKIESLFESKRMHNFTESEFQEMKDTIELLCMRGVLQDLEIDNANAYSIIGDFSIFNNWVKEQEKNKKKEKRSSLKRDILLLAIGTVFGGIVEFLLFKLFGIGG